MQGKLLIYRASGGLTGPPDTVEDIGGTPDWSDVADLLEKIRRIIEDDIEQVPGLITIKFAGRLERCVALIGENGKYRNLPVNRRATLLWETALMRAAAQNTLRRLGDWQDFIVGPMVVLIGDEEFMEAL